MSEISKGEISGILDLIQEIERVRPSLGIPTVAILASRLGARWSDIGRGVFVIGPKDWGKGEILYATNVEQIGYRIEAGDELHPRHVSKVLNSAREKGDPISRIAFEFEDLAVLSEDRAKLRKTLSFGSKMISNLTASFTGWLDDPGPPHTFDSVSWICGIQPRVMMTVRKQAPWASMWSDRFSRFALIKTLEDERRITHYEEHGPQVGKREVRRIVEDHLPKIQDLPESISYEVPGSQISETASRIWGRWSEDPRAKKGRGRIGEAQHGSRRSRKYLRSDLAGLAVLSGSDTVTRSHLALAEVIGIHYRLGSLHPRDLAIIQHSWTAGSLEDLSEDTGLRVFYLLEQIRRLQAFGLIHFSGSDHEPWRGRVGIGHFLEDPFNDLRVIRDATR